MNKICVYTSITGGYDFIKDIKKERGIDYFCFTNNPNLKSKTWKVIQVKNAKLTDVQLARKIKICGHPILNKYDIAVWIDGSVTFNKRIKTFIKTYFSDKDLCAGFKHSQRNTILEECYECVRRRKAKKADVQKLLKFYEKEEYMMDNGLIESTVYIKRPNDPKVKKTMRVWFKMIQDFTHRDQLSFNYAIYKTGLPVRWINLKVFDNEWFTCSNHGNDKGISSYRVYFNDGSDYNLDNDFSGAMTKKPRNKYVISLRVPCDTNKTAIELSRIPFIEMTNLTINREYPRHIHYFNGEEKEGTVFFYNENAAFEIYDELKKGDRLRIEMTLNILPNEDAIYKISKTMNTIKTENNELRARNEELEAKVRELSHPIKYRIKKSFFWHLLSRVRH